ncbi:hypothetical protein DUI87_15766 [Hirundo rustica rustica]|uniref:Uncharacterized protein n=1 Tax=Hirundo rustica rustica TaxID=333673 RepID=A0A3M0JZN0_HIRRU|nr:hypothetical protein DUI87_15766 [Hirundo rustica rustica]
MVHSPTAKLKKVWKSLEPPETPSKIIILIKETAFTADLLHSCDAGEFHRSVVHTQGAQVVNSLARPGTPQRSPAERQFVDKKQRIDFSQDDVYRKETQLCPPAAGMNSSRRKRTLYAPVNDLLSAALWKHAKGNVALECNVSFLFHVLHDCCLYHDTSDIHSLDILKFYRKFGIISLVTT